MSEHDPQMLPLAGGWPQPVATAPKPKGVMKHLNPQQFTWEEITKRHPEMAEHEDAVNVLGNATEDDPGAEGGHGADGMRFYEGHINARRTASPTERDYGRMARAGQGYREGAAVPPVLVVKRNAASSTLHIADGHHRITAARNQTAQYAPGLYKHSPHDPHIPAVVAIANTQGRLPRDFG